VNVGDKDASIEDQSSLSRRFPANDRSAAVSGHINVDARASAKERTTAVRASRQPARSQQLWYFVALSIENKTLWRKVH
jgi:hypothetical protein